MEINQVFCFLKSNKQTKTICRQRQPLRTACEGGVADKVKEGHKKQLVMAARSQKKDVLPSAAMWVILVCIITGSLFTQ